MMAGGAAEGGDIPGGGVRHRSSQGNQTRDPSASLAVVWKQGPNNTFVPVQIRKGLTDHTVTQVVEVLKGDLKEGDPLIIGSRAVQTAATAAPGMGGGRGGFRGR
jgi:hypothetical protein